MFRSRLCQARVARALLARVGLERLWTDDGPTPEARLLLEAEHVPLDRRQRAMCRVAWMLWGGSSGITLEELLDLMDGDDLGAVAELMAAMSSGADGVDAWLLAHAPEPTRPCSGQASPAGSETSGELLAEESPKAGLHAGAPHPTHEMSSQAG